MRVHNPIIVGMLSNAHYLYKKPEEIVELLKKRGLLFTDESLAINVLRGTSYYSLRPYAEFFCCDAAKNFIPGTEFFDIVRLYEFDRNLKALLLHELLIIEAKMKSAIGEVICSRYGTSEKDYLNLSIFSTKNPDVVSKTIAKIKRQKLMYGKSNTSLVYYKRKHNNVIPFWVLSRVLTIGAIRDYYLILKTSDQDFISRRMITNPDLKRKAAKLGALITLLSDVRNMCAHDDVILGYEHGKADIGLFSEHAFLQLRRSKSGAITQGRKDLIAILIAIKNLSEQSDFEVFMGKLVALIGDLEKSLPRRTRGDILRFIGLCPDYAKLASL